MNIRKIKSHYQVRETRNGKNFSYTFHYKPSKHEAQLKISELEAKSFNVKKSILNALNEYVATKENILSPTTLYLYNKVIRVLEREHKEFLSKDINNVSQIDLQLLVNELAKKNKPKTVKNYYGLIRSTLDMFTNFNYKITLPKNNTEEPYIPTDKEVSLLLKESQNTKYYIPIRLAIYSLRLSEILALTIDDVYDDYIYINKAKVEGGYGMVVKAPKTKNSTRKVFVDKELVDLIKKQGYIYKGDKRAISEYIVKFCEEHNIKRFTLHKLRHYFATSMHFANVPRKAIERMGGWSGNSPILDKIYTHSREDFDYKNTVLKIIGQALN